MESMNVVCRRLVVWPMLLRMKIQTGSGHLATYERLNGHLPVREESTGNGDNLAGRDTVWVSNTVDGFDVAAFGVQTSKHAYGWVCSS